MTYFGKRNYFKLSILIFSILFIHPTNASDFLDKLFGDTPPVAVASRPTSQERRSATPSLAETPTRKATQSSTGKKTVPEARGDLKAQPPHQVASFLDSFPKILEGMSDIESQMVALIPQHHQNLMNILKFNTTPDWRAFMARQVSEPLDSVILECIKKIPSTSEVLKKKEAAEKEKEAKKALVGKGIDPKQKLQKSSSLSDLMEEFAKEGSNTLSLSLKIITEEGMRAKLHIPTMLRAWFLQQCNPAPQQLPQYSYLYSIFNQWFDNLPSSISEGDTMKSLYPLLKQGTNTPQILNFINELVAESILHRAQLLYEQLLPIYLDSVTSRNTLEHLKEESLREDKSLKAILANTDLFNFIESFFVTRIAEALVPLARDFLLKSTEESKDVTVELRETVAIKVMTEEQSSIIMALQDAIRDALTVEPDPVSEEIKDADSTLVLGGQDKSIEEDKLNTLKSNLQKKIAETIKTALLKELNRATGRKMQDGQLTSSSYSLVSSLIKAPDTSKRATDSDEAIILDVAPIMQIIVDYIYPPTAPGYLSRKYWKGSQSSVTPIPVEVRIPEQKQDEWKIPFARDLIQKGISHPHGLIAPWRASTKRVTPKPIVQIPKGMVEENKKVYDRAPGKHTQIHIPAVLREIRSLREPKFSISYPKSFNELMRKPTLLYCLPRVSSYISGMDGLQLVQNLARFFSAYSNMITSSHYSLQNSSTGDLSVYLDEKRPSVQFCKKNKSVIFDVFPLINDRKIRRNWTSIYDFDMMAPMFVEEGKEDKFGNELKEFIVFLARLEGLPDEFFSATKITMSRILPTAKRVLLFKVKCEARMKQQALPAEAEQQSLMESLFEKKCASNNGVKPALARMAKRENQRGPFFDEQFFADRTLLVSFLTELFQGTITPCLSWFGMTQDDLFELKKKYTSTPEELLATSKEESALTHGSSINRVLQPDTGLLRQSLTLHVPLQIEGNPLLPEVSVAHLRAYQLEGPDPNLDDDLPPIEEWKG